MLCCLWAHLQCFAGRTLLWLVNSCLLLMFCCICLTCVRPFRKKILVLNTRAFSLFPGWSYVITCSDFSPILVTSEDTFCDWDWQYWVTAAERVMKSKQRNGQRIRRAESGRTRARRGRGIHHRSRQIDSGAERQSGTTDSLARRESSGTSRYIQLLLSTRLAHGLKCQVLKR